MTDDEDQLREQLRRAAAQPAHNADEHVRSIIQDGLRAARRGTFAISGTAIAVAALTVGGIAVAVRPSHGPVTTQAGSPESSTSPSTTPGSMGPWPDGPCIKNRYTVRLDRVLLPHSAKPVSLRTGSVVTVTVIPIARSSPIRNGTATVDIDRSRATDAVLKVAHRLPSVRGASDKDGALHFRFRLADTAKIALPKGQYVIKLMYNINCPTASRDSRGSAISIALT